MKLTTFTKAYKLALANVGDKVSDWKDVYIGSIIFPDEGENVLRFIFSSGYNMQPGDMGISAAINLANVEKLKGGLNTIAEMTMDALDKDVLAREYINRGEKINEAGRMMVLLETLLQRLQLMELDRWESAEIESIEFNFDKDLAEFDVDDMHIYTNGSLVMFG